MSHAQRVILSYALALSLPACAAHAQGSSSGGSYQIRQSVVAGGGGQSQDASGAFRLGATVGEAVTGLSGAGSFVLYSGFWHPAVPGPNACSYGINPTSQNFPAAGGANSLNVTAAAGCAWTAASNASWITITSGSSGTGNGTVVFNVAANSDAQRTGTLTVAGQTFTVIQDGLNCSYSINPPSQNFSAAGNTGGVNVTAPAGCAWTANSNAAWLTVTSGSSGTGNGTVGFSVAANAGPQRTGTLTVAGQTFTVTQDGTAPAVNTFQFSQSSYAVSEGAGSTVVTVTRAGDLSAAATVEYATNNAAATDLGDYNTTIGRLRFGAGEAARTFTILITDDAYAEGTESLGLTLSNPSGGPGLGSPSSATLSIIDNDAATSPTNPLDSTAFFVRQQYVDFFSREPDAPGLAFWTQNIDSCGADAGCRDFKRVDTSAAFFLSIEFQETGFLVQRVYRAAFNRLPNYREFIRDSQEIGRGVIVGQGPWQAQLEANKAAFVADFAARADFQAAYAGLANAQFVDAMNQNTVPPENPGAGGALSAAERDALVADLNSGAKTRGQALRAVAEDADLYAREYNRAFVQMQYFGYLRRDADQLGFDFWLGKLNNHGGDYRAAEMVRSFLVSGEYRGRFGPN